MARIDQSHFSHMITSMEVGDSWLTHLAKNTAKELAFYPPALTSFNQYFQLLHCKAAAAAPDIISTCQAGQGGPGSIFREQSFLRNT